MMNENRDDWLGERIRESDPVPDVPREEIWAGIVAARRLRGVRAKPSFRPAWSLSLAAMLAIGIAIGRGWPASSANPDGIPPGEASAGPTAEARPVDPAAAEYLARMEVLLASFPAEAREGRATEVAGWARLLLLDTRLLLDSPAGEDRRLAALLADLELVLAQIASLPSGDAQNEIELIQEGIRQNRVLARLRVASGVQGD